MKCYFFLHWNFKKFRLNPYIDMSICPSGKSTKLCKYVMWGCHGNQFIELGRANLAIFVL